MTANFGISRRAFLAATAATACQLTASAQANAQPTQFQIACMTLCYSQFPLARALTGLQTAGYRFVAWGTTHQEEGNRRVPVIAAEAPPDRASELARRCRDLNLEPVMMFSDIMPESQSHMTVMENRIRQAAAARIPQLLTFGNTRGGDRPRWIEHFRQLGRIARDNNVTIVLKPHGGLTARGAMAAEIVREINDDNVRVNYDAGNVMDYLHISAAETIADLQRCAGEVRSFCIKDHRQWPRDEDCGPGFGEIDHYRLLQPVAFTGRTMPLACENIFAPLVPRPQRAEEIDVLARRAREYLETVVRGVQTPR
jgi:sugar phosphate isomerase/epimerase